MKWFKNPETLEDLKKEYKRLAMKNHPDMGGSTEAMQEINNEYEKLFSRLKDIHKNAEGETYTAYTKTTEAPEEFMDIVDKLIHMDGIIIELCGSWLWITGDTKPHKDELKELKFHWSGKKSAWYYHREPYRKRSKNNMSLNDIRMCYGSERITKGSDPDKDPDKRGPKGIRPSSRTRV